MSLQIGERATLSVCKRTRRALWANKTTRNTDEGMRMVVTIEKDASGRKVSKTTYEK